MCEKTKITKKLRNNLWDLHFNSDREKCKCCNSNYIIKTNFVIGHIYPEICGGKTDICNLLPICKICNQEMGQQYLLDFVEKNNYDIKLNDEYIEYQNKIKQLDSFRIKFNKKNKFIYNKIDNLCNYFIDNDYINTTWDNSDFINIVNTNKSIKFTNIIINNINYKYIYLRYNFLETIKEIFCCVVENETELLRGQQYKLFIYYDAHKKYHKLKNHNLYIELYFCNVT
jgi:hypothetical protein